MNDLQYHNYGQFWYAIVPSVNRLASSFCPFYSLLQTKSSTLTIRQHLSPNPFFFFRKANGCDARLALRMRAFYFSDSSRTLFWDKT